jgi:hypothetical protein
MPDFNAVADLHRIEMRPTEFGKKITTDPHYLESGRVFELINRVMGKRSPDRVLYSITPPREAAFNKEELNYQDIEDLSHHPDFPK